MRIGIAREQLSDPKGVADDIYRRMLFWHDATGGYFDAAPRLVERLIPHMQIHRVQNGESHYLYCGLETPPAKFYGEEFALAAMGRPGIPDKDFEQTLNRDYTRVQGTQRPIHERVSAPLSVYGATYRVEFYRFVFPVYFEGVTAVAVSARFVETPTLLN